MKELTKRVAEHFGHTYERLVSKYPGTTWRREHTYPLSMVRGTLYAYFVYEEGIHPTDVAKFFDGRCRTTVITCGNKYKYYSVKDIDIQHIYEEIKRLAS